MLVYTTNDTNQVREENANCLFSVEEVFFYMTSHFPHLSFSCSHTTHGGFRGVIDLSKHSSFTTDDISVVVDSYSAVSLRDISEHCYRLALALANRHFANIESPHD